MFRTTTLFFLLTMATANVGACPFDEAGIEVTIQAHNNIMAASNAGDFDKAQEEIISQKYLYDYFEESSDKPLYEPLLNASKNKDAAAVKQLLDYSLVLEIHELLGQVEENFGKYQKSRLRLIKAKKHLKLLTSEKPPMLAMKKILKSIGNPGLMGVGKREADKAVFLENKDILFGIIT